MMKFDFLPDFLIGVMHSFLMRNNTMGSKVDGLAGRDYIVPGSQKYNCRKLGPRLNTLGPLCLWQSGGGGDEVVGNDVDLCCHHFGDWQPPAGALARLFK